MKINKNICLLALGLALLLPVSCKKDFLEQQNTRDATEGSLFKTSEDAFKLVAGIYDTFHNNDFLIKALWYQANFLTQDYQNWVKQKKVVVGKCVSVSVEYGCSLNIKKK